MYKTNQKKNRSENGYLFFLIHFLRMFLQLTFTNSLHCANKTEGNMRCLPFGENSFLLRIKGGRSKIIFFSFYQKLRRIEKSVLSKKNSIFIPEMLRKKSCLNF